MNIFENAIRKRFRFPSQVGDLTLEQLMDLPLVSDRSLSLDRVALSLYERTKNGGKSSFVNDEPDHETKEAEEKLEVVKQLITEGKAKVAETQRRVANNEKRRTLLDALANKEAEELASMDRESLLKQLADLDT